MTINPRIYSDEFSDAAGNEYGKLIPAQPTDTEGLEHTKYCHSHCGAYCRCDCHTPPLPESNDGAGELIAALKACNSSDIEADHADADQLLIDYINNPQVTEAYNAIDKWYA